ncbi:hypothetical protein SAMN04488124_3208 [Halogeometricum limi]|uniref:Uncharacterized protein n=2 Tax=Halogeometricum limi TaxID=555875 RepID=A0A1I6IFM8_9EURY|nr:hypothetical protein SAMN04488124_3208 [Halogeometricum limi]
MRQQIRVAVGVAEAVSEAETGSFSKQELETIAEAIGVVPVAGDEPDPLF